MGQTETSGVKKKWAHDRSKKENVDHPKGKTIHCIQLLKGHNVDCPASIIVKEVFIISNFQVLNAIKFLKLLALLNVTIYDET